MRQLFFKANIPQKRLKKSLTSTTTKSLKSILGGFEANFRKLEQSSPLEVMEAWHKIIDEKFRHMTRAIGFVDSILKVVVDNSSFYSCLKRYDQVLLIERLHKWVPETPIKKIEFFLR